MAVAPDDSRRAAAVRRRPPPALQPDQYRVVERWDGFRIEHPLRHAVDVRVRGRVLAIGTDAWDDRFPLLTSLPVLSRRVAAGLLGPEAHPGTMSDRLRRESWTISEPVDRARRRLLERQAPVAAAVEDRLVGICREAPRLASAAAFYRARHVVRDVLAHRAAAIALAFVDSLLWPHPPGDRQPSIAAQLREMASWRRLFSPEGASYRSLDRTLMNLPAGIPPILVCELRRIRLERPITNRLELHMLLQCIAAVPWREQAPHAWLRVVQHAREPMVRQAVACIAHHTNRQLHVASDNDLYFAATYLSDAPLRPARNLDALVAAAIRWHDEAGCPHPPAWPSYRPLYPPDTPSARPPVPLPCTRGLTFLATVDDIIAEGKRMHHCIATLAGRAVAGESYLFHAEHDGAMASLEVTAGGVIRQAAGPANCSNAAVDWGRQQLQRWITRWRETPSDPT